MQKKYPHPSWIEINIAQLKRNLQIIKNHVHPALVCLPVKANAYGHGLCGVAKAAQEVGIDYLAVAHLSEAMTLREADIRLPILVFGAIHEDQIEDLIAHHIEFSISSLYKAELVVNKMQNSKMRCKVHIEVDTGMQRTGVRPETAKKLFTYLKAHDCFEICGIYSHFATSESTQNPSALQQFQAFQTLLNDPLLAEEKLLIHFANSGAVINYPMSYYHMVRPGYLSFGFMPHDAPSALKGIQPLFTLKAKVAYFKVVEAGQGISYGHTYVTEKPTRIVTIPIGYGDGYRRALSNKGHVLIRGKRFPIVGRICMDQFMVDVGKEEVFVGDEVVLIGKQGDQEITAQEVARLCDTIAYEILCALNERIPRIYLE